MTPEELLQKLLIHRGYLHTDEQEAFLRPRYEDLIDPLLMHDMKKGVDRILRALEASETVCIYSDYDADGIPGGVILHDFFHKIGYTHFFNYIPHRHHEGYGLHKEALTAIAERGATLVITVDLGITAIDEVLFARELGIDVIITDHHEPLEVLPDAYAIINPKCGTYPDRMLCGAGVAFKLIQALLVSHTWESLFPGWEKWLLDMVGLATLSDMVPLIHENRIFAFFGMKVLARTQRPGLRSLYEQAGLMPEKMTEEDIVFSITPRLNAAGRMAHPQDAFAVLATRDTREGLVAAHHLTRLNDERKKIVARIMKEVHKKIQIRHQDGVAHPVIVLGDPSWPAGILGLIASKITETYQMTTFVWGAEGETLKGSCRGTGIVSVVRLMEKVSHKFIQFGGHDDAGGFTISRNEIHNLESLFLDEYTQLKDDTIHRETSLEADCDYHLADVTWKHYHALRQLAPFGMGNPKPIFRFPAVQVLQVRQFGKTQEHFELIVSQDHISQKAIAWFSTEKSFTRVPVPGETIQLVAECEGSYFRGKSELRLRIRDIQ